MARWQPRRTDVIGEYAQEILEVHPTGRLVVGLDGIEDPAGPASERERFAADLVLAFATTGVPVSGVRMSAFAVRPTATAPERFYDEATFRSTVLTPYRRGALAGLDGERTVLVVSGPFLHLGDLAGIWHTSAWLQTAREEPTGRDAKRSRGVGPTPWSALVDLAFRRLDARKPAVSSFDLTDADHPTRRFAGAC